MFDKSAALLQQATAALLRVHLGAAARGGDGRQLQLVPERLERAPQKRGDARRGQVRRQHLQYRVRVHVA